MGLFLVEAVVFVGQVLPGPMNSLFDGARADCEDVGYVGVG